MKKLMKRVLPLLVAATMLVTCAVPAFAAGTNMESAELLENDVKVTGTITEQGDNYQWYKFETGSNQYTTYTITTVNCTVDTRDIETRVFDEDGYKMNYLDSEAYDSGTPTSLTFENTLDPNSTYYVRVYQYVNYKGAFNTYTIRLKTTYPAPDQITVTSVIGKKNRLTVEWNPVSYAETYQVQYRVKGSKSWHSVTTKKSKITIKGLSSNRKYQVRVRGQRKVDGKTINGKWSTKTTVQVK